MMTIIIADEVRGKGVLVIAADPGCGPWVLPQPPFREPSSVDPRVEMFICAWRKHFAFVHCCRLRKASTQADR
jgi:hypothetical protein